MAKEKEPKQQDGEAATPPECFVIMPISDPDGYDKGHFKRVYEDIFRPACKAAGYEANRADDVTAANIIQLDVLERLLQAPMVLCDLSSRNPNVLFELGIRQAFDKPVVLVQEVGTPQIFDIAILRYADYRPALRYHEVLEDQLKITKAIRTTAAACEKNHGANSLVKLLSIGKPATLPEAEEARHDPMFQLVRAELQALRTEIRGTRDDAGCRTTASVSPPIDVDRKSFQRWLTSIEVPIAAAIIKTLADCPRGMTYAQLAAKTPLPPDLMRATIEKLLDDKHIFVIDHVIHATSDGLEHLASVRNSKMDVSRMSAG